MFLGDDESECLFCNRRIAVTELTSHMRECRVKMEEEEAHQEMTSQALVVRNPVTNIDLLVQSLARRFQVRTAKS